MTASIGSFSFDAMRGRIAPAAAVALLTNGQNQRGNDAPLSGTVTTDKSVASITLAVALSASYRAIIGTKVTAIINDTSIANVVVIDCHTSYRSHAQGRCVTAEWTLAAPSTWNP
jgi:hypothetical protein